MKNVLLTCIAAAAMCMAETDAGIEWTRWYDAGAHDSATAIVVDGAGDIIVGGTSQDDFVVIKYTPAGDTLWVRTLDGTGFKDNLVEVGVDGSDNVYVSGTSFWSHPGYSDYMTAKYSPDGTLQWSRMHNGIGGRFDVVYAMCVDEAGCVYVTGQSDRDSSGTTRYEIGTVKYFANGDTAWSHSHGPAGSYPMASGHGVGVDRSGNVYVTGNAGTLDGIFDYLTIKYSPDGDTLWTRTYNSPGDGDDWANALAVDRTGSVVATGSGDYDIATVKYDSNGVEIWSATYDAGGLDEAWALALDESGAAYLAGEASGFFSLTKYAPNGEHRWTTTQVGDRAYDVVVGGSGDIYVAGRGNVGYLVAKYDSAGAGQWAVSYEGAYQTSALAVDVSDEGDVYATGRYWSSGYDILTMKIGENVGVGQRPVSARVPPLRRGSVVRGMIWLDGNAQVDLCDVSGRVVADLHPGPNDISQVAPGVYLCRRWQNDYTRKVVVQR